MRSSVSRLDARRMVFNGGRALVLSFGEMGKLQSVADPGLEVRSCGNAALLNRSTMVRYLIIIIITIIICRCCVTQ
jgi:hypothetical protein